MKKTMLSIMLTLITLGLSGQNMEFFVNFSESQMSPNFSIFSEKRINEKLGYAYFSLVSSNWAEAYVGPVYSPSSKISIYTFIGIETGGNNLRGSLGLFLDLGSNIFFLSFYEKGKGGQNYWYHSQVIKKQKRTSYGLMLRRYSGLGPRIEFSISENVMFWLSPLYDFEFEEFKGVSSFVLKF